MTCGHHEDSYLATLLAHRLLRIFRTAACFGRISVLACFCRRLPPLRCGFKNPAYSASLSRCERIHLPSVSPTPSSRVLRCSSIVGMCHQRPRSKPHALFLALSSIAQCYSVGGCIPASPYTSLEVSTGFIACPCIHDSTAQWHSGFMARLALACLVGLPYVLISCHF